MTKTVPSGPCLPHCYRCSGVTIVLAYLALCYVVASLVYLVATKVTNVGTPFLDSLTPEQRAILAQSKAQRTAFFWSGVAVAVVALCFLRPFIPAR